MSAEPDFDTWSAAVRSMLDVGDHASVRARLRSAPAPRAQAERTQLDAYRRATQADPGAAVVMGVCLALFVAVAWQFGRG